MHKPESVIENKMHKIIWDFDIKWAIKYPMENLSVN